ncbi:dynein axonemal heavy chain 1-like [Homalodisca vitripennis]|uniref:dynein axonemal heavy chain 1-like n=1 Tax=Homalodisca vitripennis TaxID=197043 RepID=UPI001EEB2A23|nr:dynein axonemal heavy chain 1-like [Homalodisca vitripennis]
MHQSVVTASEHYLQELSRHNYVTPTSYLELLQSFAAMLTKRKAEMLQSILRLQTGLDKLFNTAEMVKVMQKELEEMKPQLESAQVAAQEMLVEIEGDREVAEKTRQEVEVQEADAAQMAAECQAIADDAQADLEEAMPMLRVLPRTASRPSTRMISLRLAGSKPGEKRRSSPNSNPTSTTPNFQPAKIITVSKACTSLCMWVHAIYKYYFVYRAVMPKKAALAVAKAKLDETEAVLAQAKARMQQVMDRLAVLEQTLQETMDRKNELEANSRLCEERMNRAFRLVNGLSDERSALDTDHRKHQREYEDYRRALLEDWHNVVTNAGVPHTADCNPVSTLGDPVTIRIWQLDGLPRDVLSTENAVLVFNSKRWPLFIDPQGQANRWVKNMGKAQGLTICKLTDRDLMRSLEGAVRLGKPMLIENVGLELDPALDPVLTRQTFVQSSQVVIKLGDVIVPFNSDFRTVPHHPDGQPPLYS